jgi:phage FluMu protein gp41
MKLCGFDVLDKPFFLIAGPCVIESREMALETAAALKDICAELAIPFIYKSSYDKANRSSGQSFRGMGMEKGLEILAEVRERVGVPVLTDVHTEAEVPHVAAVVDVLQTPAFLCRQTDFIHAVASCGKPVNIKKGQFLAPGDMKNVVDKAREVNGGADNIMVCERGAFGYNNLVSDMRSWRSCARPAARWSSTPPTRCSCRAGRARPRAASASSCRCWPGPPWRSASPACSWRPTPIRPRPFPTAPTRGRCRAQVLLPPSRPSMPWSRPRASKSAAAGGRQSDFEVRGGGIVAGLNSEREEVHERHC